MVYQVKDWNVHFENNKSRERDCCSYACVPNKQHGMSFSRIMLESDGAAIYGIWQLIVGACSQQRKPRNGWLTDNGHPAGTPWAPEDLAMKFRRPVDEIARALTVLCSDRVGWISAFPTKSEVSQTELLTTSAPQVPAKCPPSVATVPLRKEGKKERKNTLSGNEPDGACLEVLNYLNQRAGRHYEPVNGSIKHIQARLAEGVSVETCKAVIDDRLRAWGKRSEMQEYLRPQTLFNSEKFPAYAGNLNTFQKKERKLPSIEQIEQRMRQENNQSHP
jgi:uncharacterized phage protein (TIGR02220 family)